LAVNLAWMAGTFLDEVGRIAMAFLHPSDYVSKEYIVGGRALCIVAP
jgi:hypothetical protein